MKKGPVRKKAKGQSGKGPKFIGCSLKELPEELRVQAAKEAIRHNPVNAPAHTFLAALSAGEAASAAKQAVLTSKMWNPSGVRLTVGFFGRPRRELVVKILSHMNAWSEHCSVSFADVPDVDTAQVRVSLGRGGYWSYLGTDILQIPRGQQTMNLEGFSLQTSDAEFRRVVRHEVGHTMGFPHEHALPEIIARLDPEKTIRYFQQTQGWDRQTTIQQVLTPLDPRSVLSDPADERAIMCYQLPGSITKDGRPVTGGADINAADAAFAARVYPKQTTVVRPDGGAGKVRITVEVDTATGKAVVVG